MEAAVKAEHLRARLRGQALKLRRVPKKLEPRREQGSAGAGVTARLSSERRTPARSQPRC